MSIAGSRSTRVYAELLDQSNARIGELHGFRGGKIERNRDATIKGKGTISVRETTQDVDWLTTRIMPHVVINGEDTPLGIYLAVSPDEDLSGVGAGRDVQLLDRTHVLQSDDTRGGLTLPAGTVITTAIISQIVATGENPGAINTSDKTLRGDMVIAAEDSRLDAINALADAGGFFSIWCDNRGQFRLEPYRPPQERGVAWEFVDGKTATHRATSRSTNIFDIKNSVTCISRSSGDEVALVSTATLTDPGSPYRVARIGVRATTETGIEITDQATLDAYTRRRLAELSSESVTVTIDHAGLPDLMPNDVVHYRSDHIQGLFVVQSTTMDLSRPSLMSTTKLQKVADG